MQPDLRASASAGESGARSQRCAPKKRTAEGSALPSEGFVLSAQNKISEPNDSRKRQNQTFAFFPLFAARLTEGVKPRAEKLLKICARAKPRFCAARLCLRASASAGESGARSQRCAPKKRTAEGSALPSEDFVLSAQNKISEPPTSSPVRRCPAARARFSA